MLTLILNISLSATSNFIYISNNCNDNDNASLGMTTTKKNSNEIRKKRNRWCDYRDFTLKPPWDTRLIEQSYLTRFLFFSDTIKMQRIFFQKKIIYIRRTTLSVDGRFLFKVENAKSFWNLLQNDRIQSYWCDFSFWLKENDLLTSSRCTCTKCTMSFKWLWLWL